MHIEYKSCPDKGMPGSRNGGYDMLLLGMVRL